MGKYKVADMKTTLGITIVCAITAVAILAGCSTKHYKQSADKEVYRILDRKRDLVEGSPRQFDIEPNTRDPLAGLPRRDIGRLSEKEPYLGEPRGDTVPAVISLVDAVGIAAHNNRDYRTRREQVYLSALALTLDRYLWKPIFSGVLSGEWADDGNDESISGSGGISMSQLLYAGGSLTIDIATDLLRFMTGDPREAATSIMSMEIVQPLWRGFGRKVARENLTQAERDTLYEIREFERFRRTFAVNAATDYYRVLQQLDVVRNEWNNYRSLMLNRERAEAFAEEGRRPNFERDQARQDELQAKDRWISARENYYRQLDNFKIQLGLPTDAAIQLDRSELDKLEATGLAGPTLEREDSVREALASRLDLMNARGRVEDAERKIEVAKNNLGADIDLVLQGSLITDNRSKPLKFNRTSRSAGLDVDLPLDRKEERNAFRSALIALEQRKRDMSLLEDNIKLDVRQAWRDLDEATARNVIQQNSVELATKQVESVTLLLQLDRAVTRDLLEAQRSFLSAKNSLTGTLVDFRIALLRLWRDTGTLRIDEDGMWRENTRESERTARGSSPSSS